MLTPNALEILIHYFVCPDPHPRFHAPAVKEAISHFLEEGILESNDSLDLGTYSLTDKGGAWLTIILQTPYPKQVWIDQDNKMICDKLGVFYI